MFLSASISSRKVLSHSGEQKIKKQTYIILSTSLIIRRIRSNLTILTSFSKHPLGKVSCNPVGTTQGNKKDIQVQNPFMGKTTSKTPKIRQKSAPNHNQLKTNKHCLPHPPIQFHGARWDIFHVKSSFALHSAASDSEDFPVVDIIGSSLDAFVSSLQSSTCHLLP